APQGVNLKLVEASPAPRDPARIADSNNTFTLSSGGGAVVNGDRIQVFSDAALTNQVALVAVDGSGGFPATPLSYNAAETYYALAVDAAGNTSAAATAVRPPQLTALAASSPARAGV